MFVTDLRNKITPSSSTEANEKVGKNMKKIAVRKKIDRIILSRPAVEAGERLGFLPGDMREKVAPYL